MSGPVQTLDGATGADPVRRSMASLQVLTSTTGNSAFWRVFGVPKPLEETDPHPERVTSPSGVLSASGRAIGCTNSLKARGFSSLRRAMS